jgi:hypothetical protein
MPQLDDFSSFEFFFVTVLSRYVKEFLDYFPMHIK